MSEVLDALVYAWRHVWHRKMLMLAIWPVSAAVIFWAGLAWFNWASWSRWLIEWMSGLFFAQWLSPDALQTLGRYSAVLLLLLVVAPLIFVTAQLIAALVQMPAIVSFVASRDYPGLERRGQGNVMGSVANALAAVLAFAVLWIVTLPLWLTGVLGPIVTLTLSAFLNQRLFRYDALAEHASGEEYARIVNSRRGRMFLLGALLGLCYLAPFVNLLAPVVSGMAFSRYCLHELARERGAAAPRSRGP